MDSRTPPDDESTASDATESPQPAPPSHWRSPAVLGSVAAALIVAIVVTAFLVSGSPSEAHTSSSGEKRTSPVPSATTTSGATPSTTASSTIPGAVAPAAVPQGPEAAIQPAGQGGWANLILDSEFNGSSLPAQWATGWFGSGITAPVSGSETSCYSPSNVNVSGGSLSLSVTQNSSSCAGVTRPFTAALINTNGRFSFTYGYMEAKIWLPAGGTGIADWPAFWADGHNWPTDGEIDVLEGWSGSVSPAFHSAAGNAGTWFTGGPYAGGWHTFGADWEPGSVTVYYDGVRVWQDTVGITGSPMYLIVNLSTLTGYSPIPATMQVAYVRVWQH